MNLVRNVIPQFFVQVLEKNRELSTDKMGTILIETTC